MNYKMHYDRLIERARERAVDGYTEQHHVLPRCLGGNDSPENLVRLTPEEHFVAHQLLVKIHPKEYKLVYAALMMTSGSAKNIRNNKLYGWIRRRYQKIAQQRTGPKNSSYGKPWYHNASTLEAGKFRPGEEPSGWSRGRVPVDGSTSAARPKPETTCIWCGKSTGLPSASLCQEHREYKKQKQIKERRQRGYKSREEELKKHLTDGKSINAALKEMGYTGNNGPISTWAKQVSNNCRVV